MFEAAILAVIHTDNSFNIIFLFSSADRLTLESGRKGKEEETINPTTLHVVSFRSESLVTSARRERV